MSTLPNENTHFNTPASVATSTANITPPLETWLSRPVKRLAPPTSRPKPIPPPREPILPTKTATATPTSSQSLKTWAIAMKNSTQPPSLPSQEKPISFRGPLVSSTPPPYHIDQRGHLYMRDPSPPPFLPPSAPPSPTSTTWNTRGWPTILRNLLVNGKRRAVSAWVNKNAGSKDSRTTSANSTPTSKASSAPFKTCQLALTSTALPHPARPPHHVPSSSHLASPDRQPKRPRLPRLG